jgi:hypothetical protein
VQPGGEKWLDANLFDFIWWDLKTISLHVRRRIDSHPDRRKDAKIHENFCGLTCSTISDHEFADQTQKNALSGRCAPYQP